MIRLVIFDFDDTLTDNSFLDYQAFLQPGKQLGIPTPPLKKIRVLRKKGFLAKEIMKKFLKENNKKLINDFLIKRSKFLNKSESFRYLKLKKNTKSLLNFLKKNKIKCILCTTKKNKKMVLNFLVKNNISSYFSKTYFMKDLKFMIDNLDESNRVLIKNILVRKILKNEKIKPNEILFVGNSVDDLKTAKNMKTHFIYFQNTYLEELSNKKITKVPSMLSLQKKIKLLYKENMDESIK